MASTRTRLHSHFFSGTRRSTAERLKFEIRDGADGVLVCSVSNASLADREFSSIKFAYVLLMYIYETKGYADHCVQRWGELAATWESSSMSWTSRTCLEHTKHVNKLCKLTFRTLKRKYIDSKVWHYVWKNVPCWIWVELNLVLYII